MINPLFFCELLSSHGTEYFTGVPDSLLKSFCACLTDFTSNPVRSVNNHLVAVNEGSAIALAAGYHLATGKIPLVYMQNSGIGNAVNPLLSLADSDVYRIPMLLLVGWRGEPDVKDEPQHLKQGKVTCSLFKAMEIPYLILSDNEADVQTQLEKAYSQIKNNNSPFALIVRKDTFAPYKAVSKNDSDLTEEALISREEAIEAIILSSSANEVFISTTGMASRELFELRKKHNMGHNRDFLTVGSMGHASSLGLAIAMQKPELRVTCIDGDGAALMHMGALAAIGAINPANLRHIVLNNGAHDSVGGQPTIAQKINFCGIAKSCGYAKVYSVSRTDELRSALDETSTNSNGASFIEIIVKKGSRKDLGRPDSSPQDNKDAFMHYIKGEKT
jgi:phosphonopyruvate decarboxylase